MGLRCPVGACGAENDPLADACEGCGVPLRGYARVASHAARLFNQGLEAAREDRLGRARDLFAALVYWCPLDIEARNSLASTCMAMGDRAEAQNHWQQVLEKAPGDPIATAGLMALDRPDSTELSLPASPVTPAPKPRTQKKKKKGGKKARRHKKGRSGR